MNYVALTIGPIYKTLGNAKKPKELFSASYLFSHIMKQIIREFKSREFVVPYVTEALFDNTYDVGLFHDRFIFKSQEGDLEKLRREIIPSVVNEVATSLHIDATYLEGYLQIHCDEYILEETDNPIKEIMPYLDALELFYQAEIDANGSLKKALKDKGNFLLEGKNIVDDLKQLTYQKYFAIVHADADGMGDVLSETAALGKTSKSLFDYCLSSDRLINQFGGQTIFAGGDDLLFFAPVVNKSKDKTIFDLCHEISEDFEKKLDHKATLSFGVSITYIKFPLYEALEKSRNLLFEKAKTGTKNNIAYEVIKHSGQSFGGVVSKNNVDIYNDFLALTSNISGGTDVNNFLHSLHHKLDAYSVIVNQVAADEDKLKNFFQNYFSKQEHKEYSSFFNNLIIFMHRVYADKQIAADEKLPFVYGALRFVKFVQGDKK